MTLKMRAQRPIKSRHAQRDKRSKTADRYVAFHAGSGRTSTKDMGLSAVKSYSIVLNRNNGVALKHRPLRTLVVSTAFASAFATLLAGCVTHGQGQLAVNPNIGVAIAPPPVLVVAPPVYEEAYVPGPNDQYIVNVTDANIVVFGGNTYIWVVGHDGVMRMATTARRSSIAATNCIPLRCIMVGACRTIVSRRMRQAFVRA
jgi:hypothetical protein